MLIDTEHLISMTEANQNFSKVVRQVDENGLAVILKNNRPKYVVVDFEEYSCAIEAMQNRKETVDSVANEVISKNMEALLELAK